MANRRSVVADGQWGLGRGLRVQRAQGAGFLFVRYVYVLLAGFLGCSAETADHEPPPPMASAQGVRLRVTVADDPPLAQAILQLRGEWTAQTGAELIVRQASARTLAATDKLDADVVILPSAEVGQLAARKQIVAVPADYVDSDNPAWSDIFGPLRSGEAAWNRLAVGVPLGSPVLICYYRTDLLKRLGCKPPETWSDFQATSELLADPKRRAQAGSDAAWPPFGAIAPLGPGWAGQLLLARAAAYITHRELDSTLFDIDTLEPLIAGPPFVRALKELVANAPFGPPEQLTYDPAAVRRAFWEGQCGLAITWPSAAQKDLPQTKTIPVGFAELPGSKDVYNRAHRRWETRREDEDPHVPLLACAGRLGIVTTEAARKDVAFRLLFWLSGDRWARHVCTASLATTLFRRSHMRAPEGWVERLVPTTAAHQYAAILRQSINREHRLFSLRIPARADYLAALDAAVHHAVRGEKTPEQALREAAAQWRTITERFGVTAQRSAYWHSLGMD